MVSRSYYRLELQIVHEDPDINIKRKYLKIIIDAKVAEEKAEKARKKAKLPVPKPRLFVKPSRKKWFVEL